MKKVTLTVLSKDYTITLDDDFADVFSKDVERFKNEQGSFDAKELLTAFVQKCFECYRLEEGVKSLNLKIDKITIVNKSND